jgi:hypothetical protein
MSRATVIKALCFINSPYFRPQNQKTQKKAYSLIYYLPALQLQSFLGKDAVHFGGNVPYFWNILLPRLHRQLSLLVTPKNWKFCNIRFGPHAPPDFRSYSHQLCTSKTTWKLLKFKQSKSFKLYTYQVKEEVKISEVHEAKLWIRSDIPLDHILIYFCFIDRLR